MLTVGQAALLAWCCETAGVFMQALMSQLAHPLTRWAGCCGHILSSLYMATEGTCILQDYSLGDPSLLTPINSSWTSNKLLLSAPGIYMCVPSGHC